MMKKYFRLISWSGYPRDDNALPSSFRSHNLDRKYRNDHFANTFIVKEFVLKEKWRYIFGVYIYICINLYRYRRKAKELERTHNMRSLSVNRGISQASNEPASQYPVFGTRSEALPSQDTELHRAAKLHFHFDSLCVCKL